MSYLDDINQKKELSAEEQKRLELNQAVSNSGEKVTEAVKGGTKELSESMHNLLMATLVSKDPKIAEVAKRLVKLSDEINKATSNIKDTNFKPLSDGLKTLETTLGNIPAQIEMAYEANDPTPALEEVARRIGAQKLSPNITVQAPKVDLSPVEKLISGVEKALKGFKVDIPKNDFTSVEDEIKGVRKAIASLRFPTSNYVLPYKSTSGAASQVQLTSDGKVPVDATFSPSGTQDVNLTEVGGASFALGQQLAASSLPIVLTASQLTTLTPPAAITGYATSANQTTIIGHLDGVETLIGTTNSTLGTIDTDTSNISTKIDTLAGAVDGTEVQVDVLSMPTTTVTGTVAVTNGGLTELAAAINASSQMDVNIAASGATVPVSGTFWQATQPVSGTVTANAGSGTMAVSNAGLTALNGAISGSEVQVDIVSGSQTDALTDTELRATPVPVSGTVTANLSATDNTVLDNIDTNTSRLSISGIGHGVKTVTSAGTDEALAGSTACKRVTIQAQSDNTNPIAVGGSGVDATIATGTGVLLFPGDVFELDIDNLADVYIDAITSGEGARYTYFT